MMPPLVGDSAEEGRVRVGGAEGNATPCSSFAVTETPRATKPDGSTRDSVVFHGRSWDSIIDTQSRGDRTMGIQA